MGMHAPLNDVTTSLGGELPVKPAERPGQPGTSKLFPPVFSDGASNVPDEVRAAWTEYIVNGFRQNEEMFKRTLAAYMKPYQLTLWMYGALFVVGIALIVLAAVAGLVRGQSVVSIVFAGLGAGTFLLFFIRQPTQALEENLEFITWLGVSFNTYWTRLMYIQDTNTVQADLKLATDDFAVSVERLIDKHAALRGQRPGTHLDAGPDGQRQADKRKDAEPWRTEPSGQS
jgi:hypothetical protein